MDEKLSLTYFLKVFRRRKWGALTVVAAIFTLVLIWTFRATPIYRSTSKVEITRNEASLVDFSEKRLVQASTTELLNTQCQLLRSRTFMERVVSKIDVDLSSKSLRSKFEKEYPGPKKAGSKELSRSAGRMMKWVKVEASTRSNVINITAESEDPKIAALIANKIVEAYEDYNRGKKQGRVKESIGALKTRIDDQLVSMDKARKALSGYKQGKDEATIDSATLTLYLDKLPTLKDEVLHALSPFEGEKVYYNEFRRKLEDSDDAFLDYLPEELSKVKDEYKEIRKRLDNLRLNRGEAHPKVLMAVEELDLARQAIAEEYKQYMSSLNKSHDLAVKKKEDYEEEIALLNEGREMLDETSARLSQLQGTLETEIRIYNALQDKFKELGALKGIEGGNSVSLIDRGHVPGAPSKPNKPLNILIGLIVAGLGGLGMAFVQEHLDNTIKSQEDIEEFLEIPLLGAIPLMKQSGNSGANREIVVVSDPKSMAAEAFKTVRTGLFFASRNDELKTMLVTSGGPSEGKTMFAVNLALTMAQSGSKTLLIDADIRKPRIHRVLHLENTQGLTSYLSTRGGVIRTQKCSQDKNLFVITSGPVKTNPTELLGSPRMRSLIGEARKKFDKIIIDTPPVMTVSDPLILTGVSDGIVQVINFGKSNKNLQLKTKQKINSFGGKIVGAVLNRVDFDKNGSGLYYQNYYYSSYSS